MSREGLMRDQPGRFQGPPLPRTLKWLLILLLALAILQVLFFEVYPRLQEILDDPSLEALGAMAQLISLG